MITPKQILTNGTFCPLPWTGLMYNTDGKVKNCIRSAGDLGNIQDHSIQDILHGPINLDTQQRMLNDQPGQDCHTCYSLENKKSGFDIISDRIFYIRELKQVPLTTYQLGQHDLHTIDVRWTNLCNFACVYCSSAFSSRWADELATTMVRPSLAQVDEFKKYIFDHASTLKHVYMAGGEPLLMKENLELLTLLKKVNPEVNLRVNTNLSKTDTRVFEAICEFKNVHWTVSVESLEQEFEYIRFGGRWTDFLDNLQTITQLEHKISFNMLWFLLNYDSIFDCVDYLKQIGFHNNSFIIGALLGPEAQGPEYLNIRNLPENMLKLLENKLQDKISEAPGYLLEDSYRNMLNYIQTPFEKNLKRSFEKLWEMDQRRGLDSSKIFTDLYQLREEN
jgi:sulfatase maturation enzyme AslB (radical SAM superfamily)